MKYFVGLRDSRVERAQEHLLEEILLMTIAAVLSGAGIWNGDRGLLQGQRAFLKLPGGPSHDTFNWVISALDPEQLERGFAGWFGRFARLTPGEVIAVDGKTLVHRVSVWASVNHLVLGPLARLWWFDRIRFAIRWFWPCRVLTRT